MTASFVFSVANEVVWNILPADFRSAATSGITLTKRIKVFNQCCLPPGLSVYLYVLDSLLSRFSAATSAETSL